MRSVCHVCHRNRFSLFRGCQCGWTIAAMVASAVVAAAGGAFAAYSGQQAVASQNRYAQRAAQQQADAEAQAGAARANQIQYEADKKTKGMHSRQAASGAVVGQGSLLETEGEFAGDVDYAKQLAKYPHELAGWSDKYQSDLFGFQAKQAEGRATSSALIAGGSSLATSALAYGAKRPSGGSPEIIQTEA